MTDAQLEALMAETAWTDGLPARVIDARIATIQRVLRRREAVRRQPADDGPVDPMLDLDELAPRRARRSAS